MKPIPFPEHNTIFAKDQPEYEPLPAYVERNLYGTIIFCWKLTWRERLAVLFRGVLWHQTLTFGAPLQPQALAVEKPQMLSETERMDS